MENRRVVITGMGVVSCAGNNVDEYWDSVVNGRCGIGPVTRFDATDFRTQVAGEVKNFDISALMPPKEAKRLDMFCQYGIYATEQALTQAGIPTNLRESDIDQTRVGVLVSSGIGGMKTFEDQCNVLSQRGPGKVSPLLIPMMIADLCSGSISMRYGAEGPNMGIVTACASATHSIGEAFWMIKRGDADIMLTGGAEAAVTPLGFAGFCSMKAMSQRNDDPLTASRPFDAERDGFVMSEGAGVLVIESLEHAEKRGANIIAEIAGYGATGDAYHITSPDPNGGGAARAMQVALKHAKLDIDDVDYVNAHGTSTPLNDKYETMAIKKVFGQKAYDLSVSSTKGVTGHGLGAAGGFETIICAKAINDGIVPPTINYKNPDPECDLNYTPNEAVKKELKVALNTNLGFGGHNGVIILKKM